MREDVLKQRRRGAGGGAVLVCAGREDGLESNGETLGETLVALTRDPIAALDLGPLVSYPDPE